MVCAHYTPVRAMSSSPASPSERNTINRPFAGTSSCLLRAWEEGLSLVTVTELTLCQPPHLETVTGKKKHESPGLMTLQASFLLLYLLIYWFGMISLGPSINYRIWVKKRPRLSPYSMKIGQGLLWGLG